MKILVTGALGHIGSYLIRELPTIFKNSKIVMVDDLSTQRYCSLFNLSTTANYQFIENKVQDIDLNTIIKEVDIVVHLAAMTDAAGTAHKPELVYANNFESTTMLAQACLKHGVPLIFPSSTSVYGSQSNLVDESCVELQPQSPYAECKIKEEKLLKDLSQKGLKVAICRLGTIYGTSPGMRFHTAVNKFCWQAVMGQSLTVWETALDQKRPYLSVEDAVQGISWIIKHKLYDGEVYNLVSGNYTVREVTEKIRNHVHNLQITLVQHKIMNQLSYEVSNAKFIRTGFTFKGKLQKGIDETIHLLRNANNQRAL